MQKFTQNPIAGKYFIQIFNKILEYPPFHIIKNRGYMISNLKELKEYSYKINSKYFNKFENNKKRRIS